MKNEMSEYPIHRPNSTGKSTLLNVIAGETNFVTMDELTDYDSLSQAVRVKLVNRADREFILMDVDGLFPDRSARCCSDSALRLFCCVYAVSSVVVWNDTDEQSALLRHLLQRADEAMKEMNSVDGNQIFATFGCHITDSARLEDQFLPEQIREFLLKKYRRLTSGKVTQPEQHKPAFIFLRRDYERPRHKHLSSHHPRDIGACTAFGHSSSPWLSSDAEASNVSNSVNSINCKFIRDHNQYVAMTTTPSGSSSGAFRGRPSPKYNAMLSNSSPSLFSLSGPNGDSSPSPRLRVMSSQCMVTGSGNGNESATLSIVDELKECNDCNRSHHREEPSAACWSDMEPVLNSTKFGVEHIDQRVLSPGVKEPDIDINAALNDLGSITRESSSNLFSVYLQRHHDFAWLRQLDLFSSVDGVVCFLPISNVTISVIFSFCPYRNVHQIVYHRAGSPKTG